MIRKLRIFISSPGDVGQERLIATRVIERLQGEFAGYVELEPILWEHEPLRATSHFQEQIIPPSETDIVVCILWSRLGTRLPEQFRREDGSSFASGTEWEFEDAMRSFRERGTPDLMVYRKTAEPRASMSDEAALMQRLEQKKALDTFIDRWFGNARDTFRAAFHTFDAPDAFETVLESHLRRLIREKLPTHLSVDGEGPTPILWYKGSPFRGLEAFDPEHAPVFFGRTRAIAGIKEALTHQAARGCAFVLVLGMSGCGKSSLVRAGVLPTLLQPGIVEGIGIWRWGAFRPTDAPTDLFAALAFAFFERTALPELAEIGFDPGELAALFRESPERAIAALRMAVKRVADAVARAEGRAEPPQTRVLVIVDQMEEIFTLVDRTDLDRAGFAAALGALARSGFVWVLATMRSDFYPNCADIPELNELKKGEGQFDVLPPNVTEIGQMIRYPARAAGLRFEVRADTGEKLDETLQEAASRDPEALPLLEFTLEELFRRRTPDQLLTFAAYEQLGGPEGALARRAEEVFGAQSSEAQAALPAILRGLVTVGRSGEERIAARRVPRALLASSPERRELIDAFIAARLLVTDRDDSGEPVVRVAHEALLRHWPRLQEWLAEDIEFLQTRERVAASAQRWREEDRRREYLLPEGKPLTDALDLAEHRREDLDRSIREYIEASRHAVLAARRRNWWIGSGIAAVFGAVILGFGLFSYGQWQRSERQKTLALEAVNKLTYDVPRRLIDVPGSRPVLRALFEDNLTLLDRIADAKALSEKRVNYQYMGDMWLLFGDTDRAKTAYERSLSLAETEAKTRADDASQKALAACRQRLGDALLQQGDARTARELYGRSLEGLLALPRPDASTRRDLSVAYEKVGDAHMALGDVGNALDAYRQSLEVAQGQPARGATTARELAIGYAKLGDARLAANDLPGAGDAYRTGLKLLDSAGKGPPSPEIRRDLIAAHTRIGDVQRRTDDLSGAERSYERALSLARTLAGDRANLRAQSDLSACYASFIDLRVAQNDPKGALRACRQSLNVLEPLAEDKSNVPARRRLKTLYERLRDLLYLSNDPTGAANAQERSLLLALELTPDAGDAARRERAELYQGLGTTRSEKGDAKGAVDAFREALELYRGLAGPGGQNSLASSPSTATN
ncbi:MAG: AAA family ATPase [Capsulimonadales bacterium]|nr:AAA family ATPase [Capsulimonadales bacterium]